MSPGAGEIVSPVDLALHGRFAQELSQRIKLKRQLLHSCNEKIATKRQELVEASRSVKVLEQLRARLEEKFLREQRVAEQKQSDEVTHLKFSRTSAGK